MNDHGEFLIRIDGEDVGTFSGWADQTQESDSYEPIEVRFREFNFTAQQDLIWLTRCPLTAVDNLRFRCHGLRCSFCRVYQPGTAKQAGAGALDGSGLDSGSSQ